MKERWREPAEIIAIEPDLDAGTRRIGDREYAEHRFIVSQKTVERFRTGYLCMDCQEPQERPFPEHCSFCGFSMRAEQPARFARDFLGSQWIGPRESNDDEFARMDEENARRKHNPDSQIWIPGDTK